MKKSIDEMSANDAIELYYEKHHTLRQGNMQKLLTIKKECPEIFDEKKDREIREMIEYAKAFQSSERYKELSRLELKEKLVLISNDQKESEK